MKRLKIAIVHHHLRGGGVTRVIERTVQALVKYKADVCVLSGEELPGNAVLNESITGVISGLSYGGEVRDIKGEELYKRLVKKANELLGDEPDVWHIHNHSLGKNANYTGAAVILAEKGKKVIYQLHDFAEDNRPGNYKKLKALNSESVLTGKMYPHANHIKYAVLNSRDRLALMEAGLEVNEVMVLENPVELENLASERRNELPKRIYGKKLLIYPVRAIPRKNIGEILLWSELEKEEIHVGITLAPKNPVYHEQYEDWVAFSKEYSLPVTFEAGKQWNIDFRELIELADGIITTSIAEGFGLVYLESWLADKPLYGRLIRDIVVEFESKGIEFQGMYEKILIPVSWLEENELIESFKKGISIMLDSYGIMAGEKNINDWYSVMIEGNKIDFGRLSNGMQKQVIRKVIEKPELKTEIQTSISRQIPEEVIRSNKKIIESEYNQDKYGENLIRLYENLMESEVTNIEYLDPDKVLEQFLSPNYFSLLRE